MNETILEINSRSIFLRYWETENAKANIFIAHGLGEHSHRYTEFAEHFNKLGFNVYAHDHQGHGKSYGKQGHISHFDTYSDDLKAIIEQYSTDTLNNYLLGHSLGGVIAFGFLIRYPNLITNSIISAPGFEKKIPPNPVKAGLGKLLAKIAPELTLWNEIEADWICSTKAVVEKYQADPLVHDRVSTKFFTSFLAESQFIRENITTIKTPMLMLIPGEDLIINHDTSKELFSLISAEHKKIVEYPNSYHELLNEEKIKSAAYKEIKDWLSISFKQGS